MSIEALWSVNFVSNAPDQGAGVVIFETNRVFGGDNRFYYLGSYTLSEEQMQWDVNVTHFAGNPDSIFGNLRTFRLILRGRVDGNTIYAEGHLANDRNQQIRLRLDRLENLP